MLSPSYDKVVIAVGSSSSSHGVPGLENCFQLKTIGDAQAIRRRVMGMEGSLLFSIINISAHIIDNFEIASLPTTPPDERKRLLSFVVCGGGPTGVETAAVGSMIHEALSMAFKIYRKYTTFAKRIS